MKICWSSSYAIDHGIIDADHRALIGILNEILSAIELHEDKSRLIALITELQLLASAHFNREEHLQELLSFPNLHLHRMEHDHLLETLSCILERVMYESIHEDPRKSDELAEFFQFWIVSHILESDLELQQYLGETNRVRGEKATKGVVTETP